MNGPPIGGCGGAFGPRGGIDPCAIGICAALNHSRRYHSPGRHGILFISLPQRITRCRPGPAKMQWRLPCRPAPRQHTDTPHPSNPRRSPRLRLKGEKGVRNNTEQ